MNSLIVFSALFVVVFCCSPTKTAPRAPATTTPTTTTTMKMGGARRRRSAEDEATVTVVTKKAFDESTKHLHYEMVKSIMEDSGAVLKEGKAEKMLNSRGGKFAVEYKLHGDCNEVKTAAAGIKEHTSVVDSVHIKCNQESVELL